MRSPRAVSPSRRSEDGFGIVEVIVATTILMVVVVSLTTLLVDSLTNALLTRQRETAASMASAAIENAKAIGQSALLASPGSIAPCAAFAGSQQATTFGQCRYTVTADNTAYTVTPTVAVPTAGSGQPDTVTVTITWSAGSRSFLTTSQIGPNTTSTGVVSN